MALPTLNLMLHCDASDTDKLFKTYVATGVHTGTPADGEKVQVWDDEGDGYGDVALMWTSSGSGSEPTYRSSAPLMDHSCLDFDGTDDYMSAWEQDGGSVHNIEVFLSASSFNVLIAFYPETISSTAATVYDNHALIADSGGYWGLYLKDVSGTKTLFAYVYDGAVKTVSVACPTGASHVAQMRLSGGNLYLSIDGGSESSTACGVIDSMTGTFLVGNGFTGHAQLYDGRIGELAVYDVDPGGTGDHLDYFTAKWINTGPGASSPPVGAFCGGRVVSRGGLI